MMMMMMMMMMMAIQTILLPQVTVTAEARAKGPKRFIGNPMPPNLTTKIKIRKDYLYVCIE